MRLRSAMGEIWGAQRGHLFGWAPVAFGCGIYIYFSLPSEPPPLACLGVLALAGVALLSRAALPEAMRLPVMALALVLGGAGIAGLRAHAVAEPVLGFRYYGPIEGRIVAIDKSTSDAVRLTLDGVVLARMSPDRTPARVRVSLHGDQRWITPEPGQRVILTGHLSPPSGPVEPGGFDFQRMAWFQGLGAVGYTRTPVLLAAQAEQGAAGLWVYRQRISISRAVQDALPPDTGAFAAAIMTGDRSGMGAETLADLRASNLAHLLAISGLHMGLLTGFIFASLRYGMALFPRFALRWPVKKIAAIAALVVGAGYLALSGGNVATERAYIMVSVMLVAILLDRRALTLRAVAIAALIVLTLRPEVLSGPGFQMSFAATTGLVAVFGLLRQMDPTGLPPWLKGLGGVFVSSLVAGLATAPFAAYHFNQVPQFGLIANVLSVPLMGALVMPAAVLAALLAPLGLAWIGLWIMSLGLAWILAVARFVAGLEGTLNYVVTPSPAILGMIALGGLFMILWQGRSRMLGLAPVLLAAVLWPLTERPQLLIADSGSLIGVMGPQGRALSKETGESFAAGSWLENDGAPVLQPMAYGREGLRHTGRIAIGQIGGATIYSIRGKTALEAFEGCQPGDILISNQQVVRRFECEVFDLDRLRDVGSVSGTLSPDGLILTTSRAVTGARLWNTPAIREKGGSLGRLLASR